MTIWVRLLFVAMTTVGALSTGCRATGQRAQRTQAELGLTMAELRAIKGRVTVESRGSEARSPYPRERLPDGAHVVVDAGGLAWLRRDGGETWLIAGPAEFTLTDSVTKLSAGRAFVDCESAPSVTVETPRGKLELARARASIDVSQATVTAYVLRGSARAGEATRATMGEQLAFAPNGDVTRTAQIAWEDWTGGLGTADPAADAAPFGIGTVGARPPGDQGKPRFSLVIQRLDVKVRVLGDFALTEVDQTFVNPSSDTVEGIFSFRTPQGAVLRQFGVDRDGELVWGRVKESAEAVAQYESNVYQGSKEDPALLQWAGAGVYDARLYPIYPGAMRRVVTRYGQWLSRGGPKGERRMYVYPMAAEGAKASLPRIEELTVSVDLSRAGAKTVRSGMGGELDGKQVVVKAFDFVPRADLAIELFDDGQNEQRAYRAPHQLPTEEAPEGSVDSYAASVSEEEDDYIAVPLRAPPMSDSDEAVDLAIVVDASAATEPGALSIARTMAGSLLAHLGPNDRAALWTGDAALREAAKGSGKLQGVDVAKKKAWLAGLAAVDRGGATDIGALLTEAASQLDPSRRGSVVYIGDGSPSVGELGSDALRARLKRLPDGIRVLVAAVGSQPNIALLESVARGAPAEQVYDAYGAARASLRLLEAAGNPLWLGAKLDLGPGVERVLPRELPPISAEQTLIVVGRLTGKAPKKIKIEGSGGSVELALRTSPLDDEGDLRRRWGEQRLTELMNEGAGRASLVDIGKRFGLISPVTSWYVPTERETAREVEPVRDLYAEQRARRARWRPWENGGMYLSAASVTRYPSKYEMVNVEQYMAEEEVEEADNKEGGTGTRAKGEEGSMGRPGSESNKRYAVKGPQDSPAPLEARSQALRESEPFGMIGLLDGASAGKAAAEASKPSAPMEEKGGELADERPTTSAAAARPVNKATAAPKRARRDKADRNDPLNDMWGEDVGDAIGSGGLGLGKLAIGHGAGSGGSGFGSGSGRLGGSHETRAPTIRLGDVSVAGQLPPEVIKRIVRQNFGRFRLCYEQGLRTQPDLEGGVRVRFVISRAGKVTNVGDAGSTMPDASVTQCVVRAIYNLSFPQPGSGIVRVIYPMTFAPPASNKRIQTRTRHLARVAPTPSTLGRIGHERAPCGAAADLPLAERRVLWGERLAGISGADAALNVYHQALSACEASSWRERSALLVLLVARLQSVHDRVALWRMLLTVSPSAADAVYRFMLLRVTTSQDLRDLHEALGLRSIEPEILQALLEKAKTPGERLTALRGAAEKFPEDTELALQVLDAYEDTGDTAGGRAWARNLRRRVDATSHVRTAVGEYYFRLAERGTGEQKQRDSDEARRTFGEIVEFAPEDPLARRRLGDLLRAHGWYDGALRQYETLQALTPDDPSVPLLLAAASQGLGKTEAAVSWTEKAGISGSPDGDGPIAVAARALASAFLAWARQDSAKSNNADELSRLRARAARLATSNGERGARVILSWAHPELRPALWTNAAGTMMPAPQNHPLLGVAEAFVNDESNSRLELRLDPEDAAVAARLGAKVTLTVVSREGQSDERIATLELGFRTGDGKPQAVRSVQFDGSSLKEVAQ